MMIRIEDTKLVGLSIIVGSGNLDEAHQLKRDLIEQDPDKDPKRYVVKVQPGEPVVGTFVFHGR